MITTSPNAELHSLAVTVRIGVIGKGAQSRANDEHLFSYLLLNSFGMPRPYEVHVSVPATFEKTEPKQKNEH